MSRIFMLLVVFALTACSTSPPPSYYLLSAEATRMSVDWSGSIGIARVTVAEYLQRSEMVTLTAGNQLDIDEYRRWAEPLDSAVTRVLTLNIAALTGSDEVMHMPWSRASAPRWVIHVELQGLNVQREQIELVASWRIEDSVGASVRASRITTLTRTRDDSSARSIASDTSQLLLELSDQIVGSLSTLAADDERS